jgi:hypothetical protein
MLRAVREGERHSKGMSVLPELPDVPETLNLHLYTTTNSLLRKLRSIE